MKNRYPRAYENVETLRKPRGYVTVPVLDGVVHACATDRMPTLRPFINRYRGKGWGSWEALCGEKVVVVTAQEFTEDSPNACPGCVERMRTIEFTGIEPSRNHVS